MSTKDVFDHRVRCFGEGDVQRPLEGPPPRAEPLHPADHDFCKSRGVDVGKAGATQIALSNGRDGFAARDLRGRLRFRDCEMSPASSCPRATRWLAWARRHA
jgi:hypothetical protein